VAYKDPVVSVSIPADLMEKVRRIALPNRRSGRQQLILFLEKGIAEYDFPKEEKAS
jgi:hypothetical protein